MARQSNSLAFRSYLWLADLIYSSGPVSRQEINRRWAANTTINPDGLSELPERTFHFWRHAAEDLFGFTIACNRASNLYYIEDDCDFRTDAMRKWLISTFAVNELISESRQMQSRILFEDNPSGQRFLLPIIEAMRDGRRLRVSYRKFSSAEPSEFGLSPYCVKAYQQRWYVYGLADTHSEPRVYALDRLQAVEPLEEHFSLPDDFSASGFFSHVVGVSVMAGLPERILLRARPAEVPYLTTLPLHESQRELEREADGSVVYELQLVPNYELRQKLLSFGPMVEVLEPESLRREMRQLALDLAGLYE